MDYLYVYDDKNNKLKMEIVSIFNIENSPFNYLIYKESDNSRFYLGKYIDDINNFTTDISPREYELCNSIFKEVISWN